MPRPVPAPLSLPHRLWRFLPAGPRRRAFTGVTAALAPRPSPRPLTAAGGLIVAGAFSRATGLGEGARLIASALFALGIDCWPVDVSSGMGPGVRDLEFPARSPGSAPPPGAALLLHVNPPTLPWVLLRQGRRLVGRRRVIGFWNWELETVPPLWHQAAGLVHEAWVASHFTAQAVEKILPGRVRVVPYPLALADPAPSPRDRASFGLPAEAVIVLVSFNLASSFSRKNPLAAISAFETAFGRRTDRLLVLKVGNPGSDSRDFSALREATLTLPNVRLLSETLSGPDNHALTNVADIVLSLHRSEGFGLVPAEAMLLGKPVVATGWSGNLEFMDPETAALVPCRLVPARDPRGVFEAPGAVWAEADIAAAARALTRLADDRDFRTGLGSRARAAALARLGAGPLQAALKAIGLTR